MKADKILELARTAELPSGWYGGPWFDEDGDMRQGLPDCLIAFVCLIEEDGKSQSPAASESHVLYESELAELEATLYKLQASVNCLAAGGAIAAAVGTGRAHIFVARSILRAVRSMPGDRPGAR